MKKIVVSVDRSICMGNQLCVGEAPGIFELSGDGHAHVIGSKFTEADLRVLRSAEVLCPTNAIRVELT